MAITRRNFLKATPAVAAVAAAPALAPLVAKSETPVRVLKRHYVHAGWISHHNPITGYVAEDFLDHACTCGCIGGVPDDAQAAMRLRELKKGDIFAFDDTEYVLI